MEKKNNKVFLIDLYGTLVEDDRKLVSLFIYEWRNYYKATGDADDIQRMWTTIYLQLKEKYCGDNFLKRGEIQTLLLKRLFTLYNIDADPSEYAFRLYEQRNNANLLPGALDFLQFLIDNKINYIIATNGDYVEVESLILKRKIPLSLGFETSESLRYYKPSPNFFLNIFRKYKLEPQEVINIGDSYWSDIVGAKNVSITPIWFNFLKRNMNVGSEVLQVKDFEELKKLVKESIENDK